MLACKYAIVRFLPYPETDEFANIGVVLAAPKVGFFGFKLETRRYGRLTNFFHGLNKNIYTKSVSALKDELIRVQKVLHEDNDEKSIRQAFQFLVHPRDSILQFGNERVVLSDNPSATLADLFSRYVDHDFANLEYQERILEKRVQNLIKELNLSRPFSKGEVESAGFSVKFPLVQFSDGVPTKAIKPFFLGHHDANAICAHGDKWVGSLKRLQKWGHLPKTLFTVQGPENDGNNTRIRAFEDVCQNLSEFARIVKTDESGELIKFARE